MITVREATDRDFEATKSWRTQATDLSPSVLDQPFALEMRGAIIGWMTLRGIGIFPDKTAELRFDVVPDWSEEMPFAAALSQAIKYAFALEENGQPTVTRLFVHCDSPRGKVATRWKRATDRVIVDCKAFIRAGGWGHEDKDRDKRLSMIYVSHLEIVAMSVQELIELGEDIQLGPKTAEGTVKNG